jgi:hypothetical protein
MTTSPPHILTLRQQIRLRWAFVKKSFQLRRPLTEAEMLQEGAVALDQTKILYQTIGALTVNWAGVETALDYFNGVLILHQTNPKLKLPQSLKSKIGFFQNSFDRMPELTLFRERASKIVSELNRLKTIRHDAVHGVALERMSLGTHKVMRLIYDRNDISQMHTTYRLPDIAKAIADTMALQEELKNLFIDVFYVIAPEQAKQIFG